MQIENEFLRLSVKEAGGSLTSVFDKKRNVELLYQPLPDSWQGQDIFIFPFVARLVDGTYTHNGKEYSFKNHGLIRYMTGKGEITKEGDILVSFHSDEETLKRYPFLWEASARYHLEKNSYTVTYTIKNLSNETLPFMVGGHPAFKVPGIRKDDEFDMTGNKVIFPQKEKLFRVRQEETFSFNIDNVFYEETDHIDLSKKLFREINTIILLAEDIPEITLSKTDGSSITLQKGRAPYLALWSDTKYGDYIAMEPWYGIPDYVIPVKEISEKPGMNYLEPMAERAFSYRVLIR